MKIFKKNAFSMAEALLTLSVVGILILMSVYTAKRSTDEFGPLYYRVYEALELAAYNIFADMHHVTARGFPTVLNQGSAESANAGLCQRLIEFINVSETATCSSNVVPDAAAAADFTNARVQFRGSNNQKFYFGAGAGGNAYKTFNVVDPDCTPVGAAACTKPVNWFIIYVDLNGDKGPNYVRPPKSGTKRSGTPADIVAFAMTDKGEVVPLGEPLVNKDYMTAKVYYPDSNPSNCPSGRIQNRHSNNLTYREAQLRAFGAVENPNQFYAKTINFNDRLPSTSNVRLGYDDVYGTTGLPAASNTTALKALLDSVSKQKTGTTPNINWPASQDTCPGGCMEAQTGMCNIKVDSYKKL